MTAELRGVTIRVDTARWRETVLEDVNLDVPAGRITAVLGGPGSGKSMLARVLAGRLPTTARCSGEVVICSETVVDHHVPQPVQRVGYVPQDGVDAFEAEQTVGGQLRALRERNGVWSVERACAAAHYPLDALELLPGHNSGGQIQRAALAAALLAEPRVLVADGPTNSLDAGTAYQVWRSLREYADSGAAVLVISNEVRMMISRGFADCIVLMDGGRVRSAGTVTTMMDYDPVVQALFRAG